MSYCKDSVLKLFGHTIPLPLTQSAPTQIHITEASETDDIQEDPTTTTTSSSGVNQKPKTCSTEENETSISQENTSKKPEKILACPRCNSMDTKFCYFNNYNVNQPRHFCKKCQRYWTAGGTMRNVPVGAGRRKNKNSTASHYRQLFLSESLKSAQFQSAINGPNATVLTFACESVKETVGSLENQEAVSKNCQSFPAQVPCFPWPYPWNSGSYSPSGYPVSFCPWNLTPLNNCTYSLGKHSREGSILNHGNPQKLQTMKIDHDPGQAAKTSIWESRKKSIFNEDFRESGTGDKIYRAEKSLVLQANPAALSRSLNFHESS